MSLYLKSPKSTEISTKLAKAINTALAKKNGQKTTNLKPRKVNVPVPSEFSECMVLVQYLEELQRSGKIKLFTHIPNETYTSSWNAKRKNVSMGVMGGFPDYVVITNSQTLFIEMKKSKGGTVSDKQKAWIKALNESGLKAVVCNGYQEAEVFLKLNIGY